MNEMAVKEKVDVAESGRGGGRCMIMKDGREGAETQTTNLPLLRRILTDTLLLLVSDVALLVLPVVMTTSEGSWP